MDKYTHSVPGRANRLLKCAVTAIKYDLDNLSVVSWNPNTMGGQRRALRSLARNKDIVISKADKGDKTVIMAIAHYLDLAYEHLMTRGHTNY